MNEYLSSHNLSLGGSVGQFWTFDIVEEALVDAIRLWWRSPDRERSWHLIRACWPEIKRHGFFGDGGGEINEADRDAQPRPLPLSRDQVAEMERAGEWIGRFVAEADRKLVVMALVTLASGWKRVPWLKLRKPLGVRLGADGLRKRYSKAISAIANGLNAAEIRPGECQ